MTVRMLSAGDDETKGVDLACGVAVSPVADWSFYGQTPTPDYYLLKKIMNNQCMV